MVKQPKYKLAVQMIRAGKLQWRSLKQNKSIHHFHLLAIFQCVQRVAIPFYFTAAYVCFKEL